MWLKSSEYDEIDRQAYDILVDYRCFDFPLDPVIIANKMGFNLITYSQFGKKKELFSKVSDFGFTSQALCKGKYSIFVNDSNPSKGSERFTAFHEIYHLANMGNEDGDNEKKADHFAHAIIAPVPWLIITNITDAFDIMSTYGTSFEVAGYISNHVIRRKLKFGEKIFPYEEDLVENLKIYYSSRK